MPQFKKLKILRLNLRKEKTYTVKVIKILDFGAVVEFVPGNEVLLHISEIDWKRIEKCLM